MQKTDSTYDLAAPLIKEYVQPLWPGNLAMPFDVHDAQGRKIRLADDHLAGQFLLLLFVNDATAETAVPLLQAIAERRQSWSQFNTTVVAFSSSSDAAHNQALAQASDFSWPIAGDATGAIFASYGLHKAGAEPYRLVLVTPYGQIRCWFDHSQPMAESLESIMQVVEASQAAEEARWAAPHAPVLLVPNVLSPEECGALIETFEKGSPFMVRPPRQGEIKGNYRIPVYEHNRQDRVDEIIKDKQTLNFLDQRLFQRVAPMIQKAFAFQVTRREDLHVARYVGQRGGNKMGHRDNTSAATGYRRFALSLALNDGFKGGDIVFKEFSPRGYNPPPGTAMVFSSSLLHEVEETTEGVRYNLISHFFNEESVQKR